MIKSTSVVVCHANTLYPWYNVMKMLLYFWDPPYPNPITLVASWEKHYTNSNSGTSYNITWPLLLKTDKVINTKEILKNCHNLEEPKEIQCNLVSWMWFWNRKRALDNNLRKSEYTITWRKSTLNIHSKDDGKVETSMFWPSDVKSQLIGKDPDAGKDWEQEEKGATED